MTNELAGEIIAKTGAVIISVVFIVQILIKEYDNLPSILQKIVKRVFGEPNN